jgi:hypothetical protein
MCFRFSKETGWLLDKLPDHRISELTIPQGNISVESANPAIRQSVNFNILKNETQIARLVRQNR